MAIEHQGHQPVPRWRQGLVALEAAVQVPQGFADRVGIHLGGDSAERVGTGQRIPQKEPPEQAGARLRDGMETAGGGDDHRPQAADDDGGGNPGLATRVGEPDAQPAQRGYLVGPGWQEREDGLISLRDSLSQYGRDSSSSNSRMRW